MAMPAVRGGVRGVVLNQLAVDGLVEAIRTVAMGYVWIPPALQAEVVANLRHTPAPNPLTLRERDVTRLVATGLRNGEIAGKLSISEQTVKKHLNNIFQKLELRDRVELARYALRTALVAQGDGWGAAQSHGSTYLLAAHETLLPRERPDGALARSMRARRGMGQRARRHTTEEDAGIAAEPAALEAAPPFDEGEDGGS
jgi:DNA-binding CsgD family transcriptional regulator